MSFSRECKHLIKVIETRNALQCAVFWGNITATLFCATCHYRISSAFLATGTFSSRIVRQHRVRATVEFLERETLGFITPLLWPPNLPDLIPVDHSMWSILQEKVYKTRITQTLHQNRVGQAGPLRHYCSCVSVASLSFSFVRAGGGHFEHCCW